MPKKRTNNRSPGLRVIPARGRAKAKLEAGALSELPEPPDSLDVVAGDEWVRAGGGLVAAGRLAERDLALLEAYCAIYSRWVGAEANVRKFGAVVTMLRTGAPGLNPNEGVANRSMELMRKYAAELGISPSSRHRSGETLGKDTGQENPFSRRGVRREPAE